LASSPLTLQDVLDHLEAPTYRWLVSFVGVNNASASKEGYRQICRAEIETTKTHCFGKCHVQPAGF
jgi:hypothetical protein